MNRTWVVILAAVAVVGVVGICCLCALGGLGTWFYLQAPVVTRVFTQEVEATAGPPATAVAAATRTPVPTQAATATSQPTATDLPTVTPTLAFTDTGQVSEAITDTLKILNTISVPVNDLIDLAQRLGGLGDVSRTVAAPDRPLKAGDSKSFWVMNTENDKNVKVNATLRYVSPHVYFFIQDGVSYSNFDLKKLGEAFETKIYPTDRDFFGTEWTPGVDQDEHLYILYAKGLGGTVAGYFSSGDEYPTSVSKYSNAHEMFLLSADLVELGEEEAYGVLAHEFQHMIHWHTDRNEETWMNEGFSELAMLLNGYDVGGSDRSYVRNPDIQLNDWPTVDRERFAHYGAAFLFLDYFLDRFGNKLTQALVANPANGLPSIDDTLAKNHVFDTANGRPVTADDVFADWAVASYIRDGQAGDGRFTYHNYPQAPHPNATEHITLCPLSTTKRNVYQYGIDYISVECRGQYTLHFDGADLVPLLPTNPHSGKYAFWSNLGDESDMTLTREFDFSNQSGPLSFTFWTWYDTEKNYDYVYLEASINGQDWEILKTPGGTDDNPSGNSYGWGYNGASGRWVKETIDLSQFAGKQVTLRFEYITDAAVNGKGFFIDDISVPEMNYTADFEQDDGGWQAAGFARVDNVLPQTFRVSLIIQGKDNVVRQYSLPAGNVIDIPLDVSGDVKRVIVVVSGTSRYTREKASYSFSINNK